MAKKVDFQNALDGFFKESVMKGYPNRDLKARELHFIGAKAYPKTGNNRTPQCCAVMKEALQERDKILYEPKSGQGSLLEIRYYFPRR